MLVGFGKLVAFSKGNSILCAAGAVCQSTGHILWLTAVAGVGCGLCPPQSRLWVPEFVAGHVGFSDVARHHQPHVS